MFVAQIFFVLFALFALSRVIIKYKKKEIPAVWFIFWIIFWIAAAVVVALPQTTTILAEKVGIGRGADLAVYFSIFILFYLSFRVFVKMENIEKTITKLVEKEALDKFSVHDGSALGGNKNKDNA
jgi:hypothetical protein